MTPERFFVTGALGCIGAWVVRNLVQEGMAVCVYDLGNNTSRLRLIMTEDEIAQVRFVQGDITDLAAVESALRDFGTTHLIHLAGLQVPFCKADPALGARVNVVGTVNLFEAAKRAGLAQVVFASSIAIYGNSEEYPEAAISHEALAKPHTHYGVYKQANEGTARLYWQDDGVSSIGLRPYIVYGPGRDQGMTSSPTKAMLAAALGVPYHIAYGGQGVYQYTDDTAKVFIQAARSAFRGAECFNLGGGSTHMREIVAAIRQAVPEAQVTYEDKQLPFPLDMDDHMLRQTLGMLPFTPVAQGVAQTVQLFRAAAARGLLSAAAVT